MTKTIWTIKTVLALAAILSGSVSSAKAQGRTPAPRVVAYVPNWIDLPTFSKTIDYPKLTHINIAFENPDNAAGDLSYNRDNDLLIALAHTHHVKILMSIGGGSASGDKKLLALYFDLISDTKRAGFVTKIVDYVIAHNLDGLDVDIEGPSINKDYGAFVHDLCAAMKAKGKLVTAAMSKGYGGSKVPDYVLADLDFVNIMAYDEVGYWDPKAPGQHSSYDVAKSDTQYWLDRGLPKSKAVLGVPFYGYGFGDAFRKRDYPYADIVAAHPGSERVDQTGSTIWYNGIPTIKAKAKYVVDQGLGGIMIWSLDEDAPGDKSLLTALYDGLHAPVTALPPAQ